MVNAMIAVAIINVSGFTRLVRGEVLAVRGLDYVRAAHVLGFSDGRIMRGTSFPTSPGTWWSLGRSLPRRR